MEKKKVSLIALDMDGTLLMSDKSIHPDAFTRIRSGISPLPQNRGFKWSTVQAGI